MISPGSTVFLAATGFANSPDQLAGPVCAEALRRRTATTPTPQRETRLGSRMVGTVMVIKHGKHEHQRFRRKKKKKNIYRNAVWAVGGKFLENEIDARLLALCKKCNYPSLIIRWLWLGASCRVLL